MTVNELINYLQEQIKFQPEVAEYAVMEGDEIEYEVEVGAYEIEISHIKKVVRL